MENRCTTVPAVHYTQIKEESTIPNSIVCIFMTGFCLGMVFFYLSDKAFARESGMLDSACIRQLEEFSANRDGLLQYVISHRIRQFLLLVICAASRLRNIFMQGFTGVCGFALGILLFTAVYQYQAAGLFFGVLLFLPQWIFYSMLFFKMMNICKESDTKYYHKLNRIKYAKDIIVIMLLLCLGMLCETYINPYLVQKIAAVL